MKVTTWANVDVECEFDVDVSDLISEFASRAEDDPGFWRQLLSGLDSITRIMAGIPNEVIAKFPAVAHVEIRKRLLEQADRYMKQDGNA